MHDDALPHGELSKAQLDELFDKEIKFQLERRVRFAEEFAWIAAIPNPIARAAGQAELLIRFGAQIMAIERNCFAELGDLVMVGRHLDGLHRVLTKAAACGDDAATRRQKQRCAVQAVRAFLRQIGGLYHLQHFGPELCRAFEQIEEDLGDTSREQEGRRRRVREAVAVSVLHFHSCTLQDACRQVARGLERRGISRTPSQLQSFRDELDCKKHKAAARANGASAGEAAAQRLEAWSFRPPLKLSPTGSADTTKQQDYDALWPVAEDLVASVITKERRTEIEAAQLATEQVLDTIAPKRTAARPGPAQPSPWAKPRPDK
jgi:hypothetical protein